MIKLNRIKCFFLGLGIIFLFYVINRMNYVIGSEKITGRLVHYYIDESNYAQDVFPVVEYSWKGKTYRTQGRENTSLEFKRDIPVLLENGDPKKPVIFTVRSFWLYPLFYVLLPLALWAAFSLSFIGKNEHLLIGFNYPFVKKENNFLSGNNDFTKIG